MKVGVCSRLFALALVFPCIAWSQDQKAKPVEPMPTAQGAEKGQSKPEESKAAKPGEKAEQPPEKPAEKPIGAADFPALFKKWNAVDKQLNDLRAQYLLAPSAEEQAVLRGHYQELVTQSEKILPQLRTATEAAFESDPGKDADVNKIKIGLLAYDYRQGDFDVIVQQAKKLVAAKVEEPAIYAIGGVAAYKMGEYDLAEAWLALADKAKRLGVEGKECLKELPQTRELWAKEQAIRAKETEANDLPRVKLETSKGTIVLELFENEAPQTVGNFVDLVQKQFYDGKTFHRVLNSFVAQGGDPNGDGTGGPGYEIPCECYREDYRRHYVGALSMAHSGKDTGGSQFFITFRPTPELDGRHTCFGRVIEGMEVLPKLQRRNPELAGSGIPLPVPDKIITATVLRKRDHEYVPTKVEAKPASKTEPGKTPPAKTPPGGKGGKAAGKS